MICSTSSGVNRNSSVLSGGAFQVKVSGGLGPSGPSGSMIWVVDPPPPSLPWQFAHCNESTGLYASPAGLANNTAPRSTEPFLKYVSECACRVGSCTMYTSITTAKIVTNTRLHPRTRSSRRPSRSSSSKKRVWLAGLFSTRLRERFAHSR